MRALRLIPLLVTVALIWVLNSSLGSLPPTGRLLDPVNGCWAAAEPADQRFDRQQAIKGLKAPVSIWMEDRLGPHIRAQNNHDLYLAQGFVHASFRLWQMDLQTRAAGGRVSEVIGSKGLDFDRGQRRKGMAYGAERSLKAMEADPRTHEMLDAYTAGINAYISNLNYRDLPLEYKLMNFRPEPWTNLKCALLLKYMADDLTGASDDIAYTLLRDQLGQAQFDLLFPEKIAGSLPVIPAGTTFAPPSLKAPDFPGDSVWSHLGVGLAYTPIPAFPPRGKGMVPGMVVKSPIPTFPQRGKGMVRGMVAGKDGDGGFLDGFADVSPSAESGAALGIGSNNWVIGGARTVSGKPILCNDPHLGLNLPSLWFEVQLSAPGVNVYGASLPGAPGVVIGFNDAISWGFTNNYRDVKDYYDLAANGRESYLFNGRSVPFGRRVERIGVKGQPDLIDTVLYTIHGPVQYEPSFPDPKKTGHMLAMCWMAHRPTNELLALYLVNRAQGYDAFTAAIQHFECPAQNFAYADKTGNIAMWGQGQFINKWRGQGKYVMEGKDSLTLWGANIPMIENPHVLNPSQGYLASANQNVTDRTYPYWYNGSFGEWRSWEINRQINGDTGLRAVDGRSSKRLLDVQQMMRMQQSTHSPLADRTLFLFDTTNGNTSDHWLKGWDGELSSRSTAATKFQIAWSFLYKDIWQDDFPHSSVYPSTEQTVQLLRTDPQSHYFDDQRTEQVETLRDLVQRALLETADSLSKLQATAGLEWYKVKNTSLTHLAKIPAFSYTQLKTGGWGNTINAMKGNHGPSWRMIVEMTDKINAYGVYPGGQSGNPGSRHYGDFIDHWIDGRYFELRFLPASASKNPFPYQWTLTPA